MRACMCMYVCVCAVCMCARAGVCECVVFACRRFGCNPQAPDFTLHIDSSHTVPWLSQERHVPHAQRAGEDDEDSGHASDGEEMQSGLRADVEWTEGVRGGFPPADEPVRRHPLALPVRVHPSGRHHQIGGQVRRCVDLGNSLVRSCTRLLLYCLSVNSLSGCVLSSSLVVVIVVVNTLSARVLSPPLVVVVNTLSGRVISPSLVVAVVRQLSGRVLSPSLVVVVVVNSLSGRVLSPSLVVIVVNSLSGRVFSPSLVFVVVNSLAGRVPSPSLVVVDVNSLSGRYSFSPSCCCCCC